MSGTTYKTDIDSLRIVKKQIEGLRQGLTPCKNEALGVMRMRIYGCMRVMVVDASITYRKITWASRPT